MRVRWLWLFLLLGCTPGVSIPASAHLSCSATPDCPAEYVCVPSTQTCVSHASECIVSVSGALAPQVDGTPCAQGFCVAGLCAPSTCGDGFIDSARGEECDTGRANSDTTPNACRSNCRKAHCGDGIIDDGEACDGPVGDSAQCNACEFSCDLGLADCDGKLENGCECAPTPLAVPGPAQYLVADDQYFYSYLPAIPSTHTLATIWRTPRNAVNAGAERVYLDLGGASVLQLEQDDQYLYWSDDAHNLWRRDKALSGGAIAINKDTSLFVVDAQAIYISSAQKNGVVRLDKQTMELSSLSGSSLNDTIDGLIQTPDTLYAVLADGLLYQLPKDGSAPPTLRSDRVHAGESLGWPLMVAPGSSLYWSDGLSLLSMAAGNSRPVGVATDVGSVQAMTLGGDTLYLSASQHAANVVFRYDQSHPALRAIASTLGVPYVAYADAHSVVWYDDSLRAFVQIALQ